MPPRTTDGELRRSAHHHTCAPKNGLQEDVAAGLHMFGCCIFGGIVTDSLPTGNEHEGCRRNRRDVHRVVPSTAYEIHGRMLEARRSVANVAIARFVEQGGPEGKTMERSASRRDSAAIRSTPARTLASISSRSAASGDACRR